MPEGHVTHRIARDVTAAFGGRPVRVASPQGRFADSAALLNGTVLLQGEAAGKHLFFDFDNALFINIHLGLIGKVRFFDPSDPIASPETLRLRVWDDTTALELRGATLCRLIGAEERDGILARLGPDPLRADADPEKAWARIHKSDRTIASLLMDQAVLAGVGNIYRAEVLYRHRLSPFTPGSKLKHSTWLAMWRDLVELMPVAVDTLRIDTVRDEHSPEATGREPRVDRHGGEVYVYRRAGAPCHVCGREVRTQEYEGRNLYWCPTCQRRRS
ncbi:MAG: DNA-formamidopyrimidine glycosylase family protein [Propionibacteriaceae bacterium]|mgnify:CR=1 FL=1|nr:Fpg/Nei family DNA glycosylase [Micropruina sp.]MBK9158088.1 Fpg/Nei family DNA glycosylase [Micropruina sp.]